MKTILAAALVVVLGITGISLLMAVHAQRMAVSSSQIFIDGTPVCVMQQAGEIHAAVGMCATSGEESPEDGFGNGRSFHGGITSPYDPRLGLPPGHPPVDNPPGLEENRRILI